MIQTLYPLTNLDAITIKPVQEGTHAKDKRAYPN
tara:strand:+ start:1969 stop:2070 length:102 start_codon:yes stop_codon:yes gene_type:complete